MEVAGVKDPIPLAPARILEPPFSGDSGGTTCPVVKPNTKLDIQLQIQASLTCVECSGGGGGGGGGGRGSERGGAGSTVDIRGHGLIACFIYFLMLM